jgi:hypothetical protein
VDHRLQQQNQLPYKNLDAIVEDVTNVDTINIDESRAEEVPQQNSVEKADAEENKTDDHCHTYNQNSITENERIGNDHSQVTSNVDTLNDAEEGIRTSDIK